MNAAATPTHASAPPIGTAFAFAAFGGAYLLLALFSASMPIFQRVPLYIWPAHGLALGVLLVTPTSVARTASAR